jgi:hypothetical protein
MQRWTALVLAGLMVLAVVVVAVARRDGGGALPPAPLASASPPVLPGTAAGAPPAATAAPLGVVEPLDLAVNEAGASPGATMPDGAPAPPLSGQAPKQVGFGVVLITYRGAQAAPAGARSREEALALAASIAEDAKRDFAAAVKRGDAGFESAGTVERGVLEPAAQAVLFGLEVGEIGGPVDSPRGYYVFKRLE